MNEFQSEFFDSRISRLDILEARAAQAAAEFKALSEQAEALRSALVREHGEQAVSNELSAYRSPDFCF